MVKDMVKDENGTEHDWNALVREHGMYVDPTTNSKITLTQSAYFGGTDEDPRYVAAAISHDGKCWIVTWVQYEDFGERPVSDGSNACDWTRYTVIRQ